MKQLSISKKPSLIKKTFKIYSEKQKGAIVLAQLPREALQYFREELYTYDYIDFNISNLVKIRISQLAKQSNLASNKEPSEIEITTFYNDVEKKSYLYEKGSDNSWHLYFENNNYTKQPMFEKEILSELYRWYTSGALPDAYPEGGYFYKESLSITM